MQFELLVTDPATIKTIKTSLENDNLFVKPITKDNEYTVIRTNIADRLEIESKFPGLMYREYTMTNTPVSYTHLTLPTN